MSQLLKALLAEYQEYKLRGIFDRSRTMDTTEIYDELYGTKPPIPPPACARLKDMNTVSLSLHLWGSGLMWWPSGTEEIRRPVQKFNVEPAIDPFRSNISHGIGMLDIFMVQNPDSHTYRMEADIKISIAPLIDCTGRICHYFWAPKLRYLRYARRKRRHNLHKPNPFHK